MEMEVERVALWVILHTCIVANCFQTVVKECYDLTLTSFLSHLEYNTCL